MTGHVPDASFMFDSGQCTTDACEMCSGSEAGPYLRLIDFVYHSRVIKKKRGGGDLPFGHDGDLLVSHLVPGFGFRNRWRCAIFAGKVDVRLPGKGNAAGAPGSCGPPRAARSPSPAASASPPVARGSKSSFSIALICTTDRRIQARASANRGHPASPPACCLPGQNNYFTEMCSGSEAGSYLRLIDFCITQL